MATNLDAFWAGINEYLQQVTHLAEFKRFAQGDGREEVSEAAQQHLGPIAEGYDREWAMVREYLEHPDHALTAENEAFLIYQIGLVASGVRGARLHDNTVMLPLY